MFEPPPPLPRRDRNPGLTAFLRVVLGMTVFPVLYAIGWRLPYPYHTPVIDVGGWALVLLPPAALLLGLVAFARRRLEQGLGYTAGALFAAGGGFVSWVLAVFFSL